MARRYDGFSSKNTSNYFYFTLLGLESLVGNKDNTGKIWARELSKELDLLKADLEETFRAYAPVKDSGDYEGTYTWHRDRPLLRDTIEARKTLGSTTLQLRMAWWGHFSTDGRGAQGPRTWPHVYKLELPSGEVIFRQRTDAATTHYLDGVSPERRMNWPKEAYQLLRVNKVFQQHAENLTIRYYYAVMRSLDKLSRQGVSPAMIKALSKHVPENAPGPKASYAAKLKAAKERRKALREGESPKRRQQSYRGHPRIHEKAVQVKHDASAQRREELRSLAQRAREDEAKAAAERAARVAAKRKGKTRRFDYAYREYQRQRTEFLKNHPNWTFVDYERDNIYVRGALFRRFKTTKYHGVYRPTIVHRNLKKLVQQKRNK